MVGRASLCVLAAAAGCAGVHHVLCESCSAAGLCWVLSMAGSHALLEKAWCDVAQDPHVLPLICCAVVAQGALLMVVAMQLWW